ncbi:MAG: TrkA family potassium uptake protein [Actinomycetia bacterium]|nr:TrkA family potassium uptake protein [Actinomycetes bacterium]
MNIIIVGCGRVGSRLAMLFSEAGHEVAIIDSNPASFMSLGRNFEGRRVIGVGFDEDVLLEAGIDECDVLAAVTDIDNSNLMIAEVARRLFEVPHVLARLFNPDRENAYLQLGFDYVCGTNLVAEEMYSKVIAGLGSHVDSMGDFELLRFALNLDELDVESVRVRDLERKHQLRVAVFERADGSASSIPDEESVLHNGDIVIVGVHKDMIDSLKHYMRD